MKKCDELLKKAEVFEKLALYGDRKSFLHSISQYAPKSDPNAPTSFEGDLPKAAPKSDPTVKAMQGNLNKLLYEKGYHIPILEDGQWGQQTSDALAVFKTKYPKFQATMQGVAQADKASGSTQMAKQPAKTTQPAQVSTLPKIDPNWGARDVGGPKV